MLSAVPGVSVDAAVSGSLTVQRLLSYCYVNRLQDWLNFKGWTAPPFSKHNGSGRFGLVGAALGLVGGVHLGVLIVLCALPSGIFSYGSLSTLVRLALVHCMRYTTHSL